MTLDKYLQENYRFCPRCGAEFGDHPELDHLLCDQCSFHFYYNPALAVAVIAKNEKDEIILGKRKHEPFKEYWDTIGGFVDTGETAEEATIREFKEETNLDCKVVKYWGSHPDFYGDSGTQTINLFFEVEITSGEMQACDDVSELKFFPLNEVPDKIAFSNAQEFIKKLKKENDEK